MKYPKSMTGFGRAEGTWRGGKLTVEVRSVNHRYLEVRMKMPRELSAIEPVSSEWVRNRMGRGRIDVAASVDGLTDPLFLPTLNMPLAMRYAELHKTLGHELGLDGKPDPALILSMRDVILMQEETIDLDKEWKNIKPVFVKAFDTLDEAARIEGKKLAQDIKARLENIAGLSARIVNLQPEEILEYRDRLAARITQLAEKPEIDHDRMAQELAFYAERSDFTEEAVRLRAHIERFGEIIESDGSIGRTLDFLAQEMLREINTTSSKALSAKISQVAVEIKAELEKIREQVQNIE